MRGPRTLVGRLLAWQVFVVLVTVAALGVVVDRALSRDLLDGLTDSLESRARLIRASLPKDDAPLQPVVRSLGAAGDVRITVIRADGRVIAESDRTSVAGIESHADRPEVRAALGGAVGTDVRRSETVGLELLYVALPPSNGRVVRVAVPMAEVRAQQTEIRLILALGLSAAALAAVLGVILVNRRLARPLQTMREPLERLSEGDLEARVDVPETAELAALASTLNRMAERLSEQVRTSREEQRIRDLILSSMEEGILLADERGDVVFANRSMERHLGGRPGRIQDLFPAVVRDAVQLAAASGRPEPIEVEVDRPPRWLRGSAVPLGPEGAVLLVLRDVTEALRIDRVRRDFVTNASHELKTPAAAIQATAETIRLAAHDDPSVIPRFARQLEREAVRLSRIVADLLDLSRLESGSELAERLDLSAVVREEAGRFAERAAELALDLSIEADGRTRVSGSARDLGLLVRNLVDNAVRHTRPGGRIEVRLATEDGSAVLRVADTGIGIPTRDLSRVFERFYRVDRARSRETGGTGLGLSIVKHVAENHGGQVDVRSELGRGTEFVVRLPLARAGPGSSEG